MTPEALAALHARCFIAPPPWSAASFASLLNSPHTFLIADPSGQAFALGRAIADEAEVLTIATDPDARRRGLARVLLDAFDDEARARGATMAYLDVAEDNAPARALYAACRWVQSGRRPAYYRRGNGQAVAALILCKSFV